MRKLFPFIIILSFLGCKEEEGFKPQRPNQSATSDWLIEEHRIFDGGPGKDGIPALDMPVFISAAEAGFLQDEELIIGVKIGDEVRAYPHQIMDWHEIVNDSFPGEVITVSYCPLTGTAIGWDRNLLLGPTTFGVSGLLYNTNLIPYDRETDGEWSQMLTKSVRGWYQGTELELIPMVETSWGQWRSMYPETKVLSLETGHDRPYGEYPYGDYLTEDQRLFFPIVPVNQTLPLKERVHGVVLGEKSKVYRISQFTDTCKVINDIFDGEKIVVAGSEEENLVVSFGRVLEDGTELEMKALQNQWPLVMEDQEGNQWDIFGVAQNGPRNGTQLPVLKSLVGFWLSFSSFYPEPEIYKAN